MNEPHEPAPPATEIRWRIPTGGDPALFKLGLAQVGLATLVAALIILLTAPPDWRGLALAGLIPLAVFVAYRRWLKYQRSQAGDDNLWLDGRGLYWLDPAGKQQAFEREAATGFRIARDPDTMRPVPALTLQLMGGFESQPIELHPPATPEAVRSLLGHEWRLPELPAASPSANDRDRGTYDLALDVYSECHDDYQEWHLEGTPAALAEFFAAVEAVADLPLPPIGARPLGRMLLLQRRERSRLVVQHDHQSRLADDTIAGTTQALRDLARLGRAGLAAALSPPADPKFDLPLHPGNTWTFHLHVREV